MNDYSKNKIVLFLSGLRYEQVSPSPPSLQATATATSSSNFVFRITFGTQATINKYHFNMIVYD